MDTQTPKTGRSKHQLSITYAPHIQLQLPLQDYYYQQRQQQQEATRRSRIFNSPILAAAATMGVLGEWQRGPVIGRGASATVSIATDRLTGDVFAVKSVAIALAGVLRREQSVLSALSSPYVVSCVGSDLTAAADGSGAMCYDLFLELAPGGSLADEIKRCGGRCEEPLIRSRAGDVLRALAHVHGSGIAHCDVKGRNVLVGADGRAKLADFGCARWTAAEDGNASGEAIRGTPMFLSPEAARGEVQGTAADIWALGCTVIEMATGGAPWPQFADPIAALHHIAHSGDVPESPAWLSDEGKDFLARCLIRDPAERWTAEQLLEHPFVASSAGKASPTTEQWVSPKSILDQDFWKDSSMDSDTTVSVSVAPADRLRALASADALDWTWTGEDWIAVCGLTNSNDDTLAASSSSSSNADEENVPSSSTSSGGGERTAVHAPRGHGSSHGPPHHGSSSAHADGSSSSCNTVISGCNCNNNDCSNMEGTRNGCHWLMNFILSELAVTFPLVLFSFHLSVTCQV